METIDESAFYHCEELEEVVFLGNQVKEIGMSAFNGCRKLSSFILPSSVEVIGQHAFSYTSIREMHLPDCINVLDFFDGCSELEILTFSPNVKYIGGFSGTKKLKHIIIPESVEEFGHSVFMRSGLEELIIPASFTGKIADNMCLHSESLKYVDLGNASEMGYDAFEDCTSLTKMRLSSNMTTFDEGFFGGCTSLSEVTGDFVLDDHRSVVKNGVLLAFASGGLGEFAYVIPKEVTRIGNKAFMGSNTISGISFHDDVKQIGVNSFTGCTKLKEVSLSAVEEIDGYAFSGCTSLERVFLPEGLIAIESGLFYNCSKLHAITIPKSVKRIGVQAFKNCRNLDTVYCKPVDPPIFANKTSIWGLDTPEALMGTPNNQKILVPSGCQDSYANADEWNNYKTRIEETSYPDVSIPDYYISTDYSRNAEVITIHKAKWGNGINIVLMGDGFVDKDINSGKYLEVMNNASDVLFSEEPYKSFKDLFNVYAVIAVSATEGYEHGGRALETSFYGGVQVGGNHAIIQKYAKQAVSSDDLENTLIIVMMNRKYYAGTCYMFYGGTGDYGSGLAISYFPLGTNDEMFKQLLLHEAGGHGFAKLADEYEYSGTIGEYEKHSYSSKFYCGWWKNIDFTDDPNMVKWSKFIVDSRYSAEGIGIYEGACTYAHGAWRPTENSIMRYNTGGFNAPSRYAIWYRIHKLAYGNSWNGQYEDFVIYDQINRTPAAAARRAAQRRNYVERPLPPLPAPVVVGHSWREELEKSK